MAQQPQTGKEVAPITAATSFVFWNLDAVKPSSERGVAIACGRARCRIGGFGLVHHGLNA